MTKPRRPTLPLTEWRIATSLDGTKRVQGQPDNPVDGCNCDDCRTWRKIANQAVPTEIKGQLARFGIDVARPTDTYVFSTAGDQPTYRVMYHTVGKVLSGPDPWKRKEWGWTAWYTEVHDQPTVSMRVVRATDLYEHAPKLDNNKPGELLCIDILVDVQLPRSPSRDPSS